MEGEAAAAAAVVEVLMVGEDGGEGASDSLTRSTPRVVILIVDQRGVHHDDELRVRLDLDTNSLQSLLGLLLRSRILHVTGFVSKGEPEVTKVFQGSTTVFQHRTT